MKTQRLRYGIVISIMFIALSAIPSPAAASENVTGSYKMAAIPDLVEKASAYDGARIEVVGEVVGDKLARPDGVWLTVLAGGTAIGVFASAGDVSGISAFGSYASSGDRVRVQGVFHRACPDHGGDLDLHAETVTKLADGRAAPHAFAPARVFWAVALCLSGTTLAALWRLRERRRKIG
ncbi:DNA-binding protein [bacterium]|nr:DNA-binding protein [bacterium]